LKKRYPTFYFCLLPFYFYLFTFAFLLLSFTQKMKHTKEQTQTLIETLKLRFEKFPERHPKTKWEAVEKQLSANPEKLQIIFRMEETGGEPDVMEFPHFKNEIIFCDCAIESPKERRSFCYDKAAMDARKLNKPANSAMEVAKEIGIELLTSEEYKIMQNFGNFDTKTSSWLNTPDEIRKLGGAIFGDKRYQTTFIYHNGADSYYAARGFRGLLRL
jgi:hypothetical protein